MSETEERKARLNNMAEQVCKFLLPNGKKVGGEWHVGSIKGEEGDSLKICLEGEKTGVWADFATDDHKGGDFVSLWMSVTKKSWGRAIDEIEKFFYYKNAGRLPVAEKDEGEIFEEEPANKAGQKPSAFDWDSEVQDIPEDILRDFMRWRGLSLAFCDYLQRSRLIGLYHGIAFPLHLDGAIIGAHYYKGRKERWRVYPLGTEMRPLVLGDLSVATIVHVFESQWDAFVLSDRLGLYKSDADAVIITRGAGNGRFVKGLINPGTTVYAYKQNDELKNGRRAGDEWLNQVSQSAGVPVRGVVIPTRFKDLNEWTKEGSATARDLRAAMEIAAVVDSAICADVPDQVSAAMESRPVLEFFSPLQIQSYAPPEGTILVGDCHVVRGSVFVIGGAAGVGKSRSVTYLAVAGAQQSRWFDLEVHARFRTLVIQNENGMFRLNREFAALDCSELDRWIRICPPPPLGFRFDDLEFTHAIRKEISEFKPGVVIIDPWNAAAPDDKAKDYLATFEEVRRVVPPGDNAPALGIVAHTRKPKSDDRASGRGLLNLLSGSYVLGSVPRTVFVMQSASEDPEDDRVVWTCCKNNDGELGERTAWHRRDGLFTAALDFNWEEFKSRGGKSRSLIGQEDVAAIFENGRKSLPRAEAVKLLTEATGARRAACYVALKGDGRFAAHLRQEGELLSWFI